ncbi:MAG TPA: GGDEF and EAL domain-containing protein, partial [Chromatiaceae bacterium]|nr:GGDEF and EAL domain-containing protein [Chromatiaceae bacterium]
SLLERSLRISSDEMRELYEKLRVSAQARLAAIARAVPDMLFFQDEEGVYLEVITARPQQLHVPVEAIIGKRPGEIFEPEQAERFMNLIRRTLENGEEQTLEYWLDLAAGRRRFEAHCVLVDYQVEGRRTLLTVVQDITERRQEETWSRLVGRAVSSAQEAILILDEHREILFSNPAWHRLVEGEGSSLPPCVTEASHLWQKVEEQGGWREEIAVPGKAERWWWVRVDKVKLEKEQRTYYVVLLNDVTELHASRRELEHMATHDALTGLPNRLLFRDRLEQALGRARRQKRGGAVMFIDLDRFKGVNDTLGHQAGDRLLQEVAGRLRRAVRESDTLARLGGDEFLLLVEEVAHRGQVVPVLEKLMEAFREPFHIMGKEFRISASVGVSLFPEDGEAVDVLLRHADAAMYSAKSGGGGRGRIFSRGLDGGGTGHAFELEQSLRRALNNDQLYLVYQPQCRIDSGQLTGLEVLLRWRSERWGELAPARFIPVAEASGFMDELGVWVLETACGQYREWCRQGLKVPRLSINLSACELRQPRLTGRVREVLLDHGVPFERVEFEITESMILGQEGHSDRNLMA